VREPESTRNKWRREKDTSGVNMVLDSFTSRILISPRLQCRRLKRPPLVPPVLKAVEAIVTPPDIMRHLHSSSLLFGARIPLKRSVVKHFRKRVVARISQAPGTLIDSTNGETQRLRNKANTIRNWAKAENCLMEVEKLYAKACNEFWRQALNRPPPRRSR
jgi:hypothetical protein